MTTNCLKKCFRGSRHGIYQWKKTPNAFLQTPDTDRSYALYFSLSLSLWLFLKPIKEKTTTANACLLQLRIHKRYPHRLPLPHSTPQFTVALAIVLLFSSFFNLKSCFFTKFYSRKIYIKSNICI